MWSRIARSSKPSPSSLASRLLISMAGRLLSREYRRDLARLRSGVKVPERRVVAPGGVVGVSSACVGSSGLMCVATDDNHDDDEDDDDGVEVYLTRRESNEREQDDESNERERESTTTKALYLRPTSDSSQTNTHFVCTRYLVRIYQCVQQ